MLFDCFECSLEFCNRYSTMDYGLNHLDNSLLDYVQPSFDCFIGDFTEWKDSAKELVDEVVASLIGDESLHDWVMDTALFNCCWLKMAFIVP